jgi:autotransporter-associated beta strand protein
MAVNSNVSNAVAGGVVGVHGHRAMRHLVGRSVAGLLLAGTAMVPVSAQVLDLGGVTVARTELVTGGPYTVITNGTLQFTPDAPNAPHIFGGQLTDGANPFALTKLGLGDLTLTGTSNDFTGNTRVENGRLIAGATNTLSANSLLQAVSLGIVELNGFSQVVAGLSGGGSVSNTSLTPATFTIAGNTDSSFAGGIAGNIQVIKNGAALQELLGASSYTGGTILNGGTLGYGDNAAFGTGSISINAAGASLRAMTAGHTIANNVILNASGVFNQTASSTFTGVTPALAR